MLLQNPQLAYALLQAQIVMKIVDPQVAMVSAFVGYAAFTQIRPNEGIASTVQADQANKGIA